jgi:hypothetical protein
MVLFVPGFFGVLRKLLLATPGKNHENARRAHADFTTRAGSFLTDSP